MTREKMTKFIEEHYDKLREFSNFDLERCGKCPVHSECSKFVMWFRYQMDEKPGNEEMNELKARCCYFIYFRILEKEKADLNS